MRSDLVNQINDRLPGLVRDCRYAETSHACTMLRRAGDLVEWNDGAIRETIDVLGASDREIARALAWCAAKAERHAIH